MDGSARKGAGEPPCSCTFLHFVSPVGGNRLIHPQSRFVQGKIGTDTRTGSTLAGAAGTVNRNVHNKVFSLPRALCPGGTGQRTRLARIGKLRSRPCKTRPLHPQTTCGVSSTCSAPRPPYASARAHRRKRARDRNARTRRRRARTRPLQVSSLSAGSFWSTPRSSCRQDPQPPPKPATNPRRVPHG